MAMLYRSMIEDADGKPKVGSAARRLGVRGLESSHHDIFALLSTDRVKPSLGGMSATPDDPNDLPPFLKPVSLGGRGRDPVWVIDEADLGPDLIFVPDTATHGVIAPVREMTRDEYERALASTRDKWRLYCR